MKYVVEIDDETTKGAQLISYIEKLRAPKKAVSIKKERIITDEEMGFPGPKLSKAQLNAWLEPKGNEKGVPLKTAISAIKRSLIEKSKTKNKR